MDSSSPLAAALTSTVPPFQPTSKRMRACCLGRKPAFPVLVTLILGFTFLMSSDVSGQNIPDTVQAVTVNFDGLPTNTIVTNQYQQVKFSASGFSAGSGGPYGLDLYTQNNSGLGSSPYNAIRGLLNSNLGSQQSCYGAGSDVFLDFPVPVNNLSFLMLNMYANYYGAPYYTYFPYTSGMIDVYVNRLYYGSYNIDIPGQYRNPNTPLPINFLTGI
jgi:hypothetical protein